MLKVYKVNFVDTQGFDGAIWMTRIVRVRD